MEFHEYIDIYRDQLRSAEINGHHDIARAIKEMGPDRFLHETHARAYNAEDYRSTSYHAVDWHWHLSGRPYYRIYPQYVRMFADTKLDIPMHLVVPPFDSFAVRFAKGHEPRFDNYAMTAFAFSFVQHGALKLMRLVAQYCDTDKLSLTSAPVGSDERRRGLHAGTFQFSVTPSELDLLVTDHLKAMRRIPPAYWDEVLRKNVTAEKEAMFEVMADFCVSIAVSVCFLATGEEKIIEPDVLNKDFQKYLEAVNRKNDQAVEALQKRATEVREQVGFTIGRRDHLLGRRYTTSADSTGERELRYSHIRKMHTHKFRVGPGRKGIVVKWIRTLVIRPDLPADPRPRGEHTPKE